MGREIVAGIVRGTDGSNTKSTQDALRSQAVICGELGLCLFPDHWGGLKIQDVSDVEITFELEMRPVKEWIAQGERYCLRPGQKLFIPRRIAGAELLGDAVGSHRPPFVVITLKPDFKQIAKAPVLGDVGGRKVSVVVEDGLIFSPLVINLSRRLSLQQEIRVNESHFGSSIIGT